MPKQSIGPEARIIQLFDLLPDESQRIVRDIINAKRPAPRMEQVREPKASKKGLPPSAPKVAEKKDPKCGICYEIEDHENHDLRYSSSHPFDPPKSAQRAKRKSKVTAVADQSSEIEKETALGAGAGD